jgi:hypothetical protein
MITTITFAMTRMAITRTFYAAEAGLEEARARLRLNAGSALIADAYPSSAQWRAYIGPATKVQAKGYDAGQAQHVRKDSLQANLNYVVMIRHRTDGAGQILYWGDENDDGINTANPTTGDNIYVVTSWGYAETATRMVEMDVTREPPIDAPSALYVEASTTIQGSSTNILGNDACGTKNKTGIRTTLSAGGVTFNGNPTVLGVGGTPSVVYNTRNLDVQAMVDEWKPYAQYTYDVTSATHSGMHWGTPTEGATLQDPSACSEQHVVYYNTNDTYISLTGQSSGCGVLLVEGDLNVHGGFSWYGPILITGSVTMTGGGGKNITGSILAGGSVDGDLVGGSANIVYCSQAIEVQSRNRPVLNLSWREP